jgi:chromosome partitioning protein
MGARTATSRPVLRHPTAGGGSVEIVGMVYAIANQKGGVGKTTTAVNVCACVARTGHRTLLVDVDPQANATVGLGLARSTAPGVYEVLSGGVGIDEAIIDTAIGGLSLVPAGAGLAGASIELPREVGFERRLEKALGPARDPFSYVVLDCPPSLGPLTINALVAADRVIVPVQSEYFALEGLASLLETLGLVQRELNPRLTIAGMLLTMHDGRTHLGRDVEVEVRRHFPELVFETVIPRNVRVGEAPSHGVPVIEHDPSCAGAEAYSELARELVAQ